MRLAGKTAVVSGGAGGIGYAVAKRFIQEGTAGVVIADVDEASGQDALRRLRSVAPEAKIEFVRCDVTNRGDVQQVVDTCTELFGGLDISVSCAGILQSIPFLELKEAEFERVMDINVLGTFLFGQVAARRMVELGRRGSIVNFSSIIAKLVSGDQAAYAASKGAVQSLTAAMAIALVEYGIRVNAVGPGVTDTPMFQSIVSSEAARQRILSRTPMGRPARPDEIASLVLFLASDEASYVTGQTYYADGGRLVLNYTVPVKELQ